MKNLKTFLLGKPKDPLASNTHRTLALTIFFAWVGLGADGISSSCYGPEQAFLALGKHHSLALWVAIAIFVTVFIIAFAYNRVIELFPNGGGGYKVATRLLGDHAGLISGIALILDYVLTIVISVTSGIEALFSIFHYHSVMMIQVVGAAIIIFMTYLNMRGMKESIKVMLPIFLGFMVMHVIFIVYGISLHVDQVHIVVHDAQIQTRDLWHQMGLIFILVTFMHAYAQGGATYTGLEAVSNNVNILAEPRIRTGKWVMFLMALSLGIIAGGILLLYMLWHVHAMPGQTLNAVVFSQIVAHTPYGHLIVTITLLLETGLLFIAANTGFLGGPAVLANMAVDQWLPRSFINVSDRLVKQNGILLFSVISLLVLFITSGNVRMLVVIYSLSVFLAFSLALMGLLKYYTLESQHIAKKLNNLIPIFIGLLVCVTIFCIVVITNIGHDSILGLVFIGLLIAACLYVKKTYRISRQLVKTLDKQLRFSLDNAELTPVEIDPFQPTAVIFVSDSIGPAMHTLLAIKRYYGDNFVNFVYINVGIIDSFSMIENEKIKTLKAKMNKTMQYLENFCHSKSIPVETYSELTVDYHAKIHQLVAEVGSKYNNCTFFASQLIFPGSNWVQKLIFNKTISSLQYEVYSQGYNMMVMPVRLFNKSNKG